MIEIDDAIRQVEMLYRTVTGREVPQSETPYAPIPAENDPQRHVEMQIERLIAAMPLPPVPARTWTPAIEVWESQAEIVVRVELAGVPREAIDIAVAQNLLSVSGRRSVLPTENGELRLRGSERPHGMFRRLIALPMGLDPAQMNAQMKDGVLEIRIPRSSASQQHLIAVK
jgi:HSP20 family protein